MYIFLFNLSLPDTKRASIITLHKEKFIYKNLNGITINVITFTGVILETVEN